MQGHVRKRGKSWSFVVHKGRKPDGRRWYSWRGSYRTKEQAQRALRETLRALETGTHVERSSVTTEQWLQEWLAAERINWRKSTFAGRVVAVENHLVPRLGDVRLQALTPQRITAAYAELLEKGGRGEKPLSPRTVRIAHTTLRKALADAVEARLLDTNPAAKARPPRASATEEAARTARTFWSAEEVSAFLRHVRGDRLFAL